MSHFKVIRASQLVLDANILGQVDMSYELPDHSFLLGSFMLDCNRQTAVGTSRGCERIRYKVNSIKNEVYSTIANLESSIKGQGEIDCVYDLFCSTVKHSMNKDLEKNYKIETGVSNKKRKLSNDVLSGLWNEMCALERARLRENNSVAKIRRKQAFTDKRRDFDKEVRSSKRRYKHEKDKNYWKYRIEIKENFGGKLGQLGLVKPGKIIFHWRLNWLMVASVSNELSTMLTSLGDRIFKPSESKC